MRRTLTGNGAGIAGGNTFKRAAPAARPCCCFYYSCYFARPLQDKT